MAFHLLLAEKDAEFRRTLVELVQAVRVRLPVALDCDVTSSPEETREQVARRQPDALLLDWHIAAEGTPEFIRDLQALDPGIRILVLLPGDARQYRLAVWAAGACAGIPRERVEAEWLTTAVCIMQRAMQREANLRARVIRACPGLAEVMR
ncbi:MAG: hypothetical protein HY660_05875 [Armatimonadetes bacterium]|nr:hypothetical protein [Armatimonadota bacterium]